MNPPLKPPRDWFPWIYWSIFFLIVPLVAVWVASKPAPQVNVPMTARELPPYHLIVASDVVTKAINPSDVVSDTIRDPKDLVGYYTRETILEGKPIRENQIGGFADLRLISNTLAIAIPANNVTTLGGNLRAGDVVSLATVPISDTNAAPTIVFNAVLVLDVKGNDKDAVIVLAISADRWLEYLAKTRNAQVVLARRIE